jgi:hypothetical protein
MIIPQKAVIASTSIFIRSMTLDKGSRVSEHFLKEVRVDGGFTSEGVPV